MFLITWKNLKVNIIIIMHFDIIIIVALLILHTVVSYKLIAVINE